MKHIIKDIFLVGAMGAVILMCVGLALYEFIPSSLTISRASQYETSSKTTEILSDAQEVQDLLAAQTSSKNSSSNSAVVKTNIILKEYDVSKTDLARYRAVGAYVQGRADPFAEVSDKDTTTGGGTPEGSRSTSGNTTSGSSSGTTASDGTFYNTARTK